MLEGDNLHSLYLLEKTHKNKIDFIYIDPPYNTLKNDFIYEDRYLGDDDGYKHSKWISFMRERLEISHRLLTNRGIIFISIDDHEFSQLRLLMDSVFGEKNYVETFIWEKNPNPTYLNKYSRSSSEYILCYAKNKSADGLAYLDGGIVESSETDAPLQNKGNPIRQIKVLPKISKCLFDDCIIKAGKYKSVEIHNDVKIKNGTNVNEFIMSGTFRMTEKTLYERIENGEILIFKSNNMAPRLSYTANKRHSAPLKNLYSKDYGTTQIGNNQLEKILGKKIFDNPKPVTLIKKLIQFFPDNNKSIVLDFFAGSGTTGQAVVELNNEDGGNRKFILCTNNENNICEEVTYQRIKTVITGKRQDESKYSDGVSENLKYYKTDFIRKDSKNVNKELSRHVKELIELEWGVNIDKKEHLIVLTEEELDRIEEKWDKLKNTVKSIYRDRQVVYTGKQKELFKNINNYIIPDYYFDNELKEVGENW